jgi:hypothetical protein
MLTEGMATLIYHVEARPWEHGWELHIENEGVTQSHTLADAERMVRDYLCVDGHSDVDTAEIEFVFALDGLEAEVDAARELTERASRDQQTAAKMWRDTAARLRESGLSVSDTAAILGVTKARVSQLTARCVLRKTHT